MTSKVFTVEPNDLDVFGVLFDLEDGNCCDEVKRLLPVLEATLGEKQVLPIRKTRSIDELYFVFKHSPRLNPWAMLESKTNRFNGFLSIIYKIAKMLEYF